MGSSFGKNHQQQKQQFCRVFASNSLQQHQPAELQLRGKHPSRQQTLLLQEFSWETPTDEIVRGFLEGCLHPPELLDREPCLHYTSTNESHQQLNCRRWYFRDRTEKDKHLSNLLQLKELSTLRLYSELNEGNQDEFQFVETSLLAEGSPLNIDALTFAGKLSVLQFCCVHLIKLKNAVIDPECIEVDGSDYRLTNVDVLSNHPQRELLEKHNFELVLMRLFALQPLPFQRLLETEQSAIAICIMKELDLPIMLRDIVQRKLNKQIDLERTLQLLEGVSLRGPVLNYKMDSLHACLHYRSKDLKDTPREWMVLTAENRVYFYHLADRHPHTCSLVRKRRRISVQHCSVVFDEEECELIFQHPQQKSRQHLVRANEFELQQQASVSDITLHQKLPVGLNRPRLYLSGRKLYLLEKNLYVLELAKPRVLRELAKQIGHHLHLLINSENGELHILQASRDIFKEGIRLWSKEGEVVLFLAGNEQQLSVMGQLQLHLDEVLFCLEVFLGVFLVMSSDNLYVLDLNYKCFFSYASSAQIANHQENKQRDPLRHRYMFDLLDQHFEAKFVRGQASCCVLRGGKLHILGVRGEEIVVLVYSFEPLLGALRLEEYRSFMYDCPILGTPQKLLQITQLQPTVHKFLIDPDELFMFKYEAWCYSSDKFLQLHRAQIVPSRSSKEFRMHSEPTLCSLKEEMEALQLENQYYSEREARLMVHRISDIYLQILSKQITHRGLITRSLFFTASKLLKLVSWAEPPRVEFVSDYKDFMLLIYNVLTGSQLQKLTTQAMEAAQNKYDGLEDVYKLTLKSIKMPVAKEVPEDLENNALRIRESLEKDLTKNLNARSSGQYVFNLVAGTNLLYLSSLHDHSRLLKILVMQEDDPFTFLSSHQTLWNQQLGVLYVMAEAHFYSLKIEPDSKKDKNDQKVRIEDEEFLPVAVRNSSLCLLPTRNHIYSFGGTEVTRDGTTAVLSKAVFVFDSMKLSWEERPPLCCTLCGAAAVVSVDCRIIYLFGGASSEVDLLGNELKLVVYDVESGSSKLMIDVSRESPYLNCWNPPTVLSFSSDSNLVFAFYHRRDKTHYVRLLELTAGGLDLNFTIDEAETEDGAEPIDQPTRFEKALDLTARATSFSARQRSIYHLDAANRLLIVSFKNIAQPFLEVIETPES